MKPIYYFGCIDVSGHHLHGPNAETSQYADRNCKDFAEHGRRLDGAFCPPESFGSGLYVISQKPPWNIISWWDYSVDSRQGSHSTFICQGYESLEEFWKDAQAQFPSVFKRQRMPVYGGLGSFLPSNLRGATIIEALSKEKSRLEEALHGSYYQAWQDERTVSENLKKELDALRPPKGAMP